MKARLATLLLLLAPCLGATLGDAHPLRNVKAGEAAPPFSLKDAKGKVHQLEKYKGKPVVLCYFRPGQTFSESVLASLGKAHAQFSGKGVVFLALTNSAPEGPTTTPPFPVLDDGQRDFYGSWGLFILPTTIVLDREHRVSAAFGSRQADFDDALAHSLNVILGIKETVRRSAASVALEPSTRSEVLMARGLLDQSKPSEALALLEPLLKAPGAGCPAQVPAADALLRLKRAAEAKPLLAACLKADPASGEGALLMGRALTLLGEHAPAEEWLKKALMSTPGNPAARFYLGALYEKTGRKDQALNEYRGALERLVPR